MNVSKVCFLPMNLHYISKNACSISEFIQANNYVFVDVYNYRYRQSAFSVSLFLSALPPPPPPISFFPSSVCFPRQFVSPNNDLIYVCKVCHSFFSSGLKASLP